MLKTDPIPLLRRKGGLIFGVLALGLLFVYGGVAIWEEHSRETQAQEERARVKQAHEKEVVMWISSPRVGDTYSADLSLLSRGYRVTPAWGAMKLISIDADHESFILANTAYQQKESLDIDIKGGKTQAFSYYDPGDVIELTSQQLQALAANETIYDVHR